LKAVILVSLIGGMVFALGCAKDFGASERGDIMEMG